MRKEQAGRGKRSAAAVGVHSAIIIQWRDGLPVTAGWGVHFFSQSRPTRILVVKRHTFLRSGINDNQPDGKEG